MLNLGKKKFSRAFSFVTTLFTKKQPRLLLYKEKKLGTHFSIR